MGEAIPEAARAFGRRVVGRTLAQPCAVLSAAVYVVPTRRTRAERRSIEAMRALAALPAAAVAFLLFVSAEAATPATAKRSPSAVYRALRTLPFQPATVDGRFGSAKKSVVAPSTSARRHHAIGTIRTTFGRGQGTIDYTVFRSHTSAVNTWYDDVTAATNAFNFQARLRVYGLAAPNVLYLGGCTSAATFADCSSFVSTASFVTGTVKVDVSIAVLGQEPMYDQSAAMSLARAANAHLLRLS